VSAPQYDEIGKWSEVKLDIVRRYATEYSKILSKESVVRRHLYIDAFAGSGVHRSKTTGEYVAGSPLNALYVQPPFSEYHFIDLDDKRVEQLIALSSARSDVTVHQGDCNQILLNDVFPRCAYTDYARGLCLLDPYRLNLDWQILETAGQMESIEVFYNFMISDANRNVLWHNPEKVRQSQKDKLTRVWGDESWRDAAYRTQKGLFGDIEEKSTNDRVVAAFQKRLRKVAGFRYVPDPIPMRNSNGATIYYLFFASPNSTGAKIVEYIFGIHR
jgi:three-Cys-motif partner protein